MLPPISRGTLRMQWAALFPYLDKLSCGLLGRPGKDTDNSSSFPVTRQDKEECVSSNLEPISTTQVDQSAPHTYPLTEQQVEDSIQAFIDSIDKTAVCDLASKHKGGSPCRIVDQRNGSFNICFFVLFDDGNVTWVLRIPIVPVTSSAWAKVVSEVATTRYATV